MPKSTEAAPGGPEVWYVAITDFPQGLGSTTRSRSICTALRLAGRQPRLLIPYAIGHGQNERAAGVEEGLPFEYLNRSTERPRGAGGVVQAKLAAAARLSHRLWTSRRSVSSVFLYNMSAFDAWPVLTVARACRIPIVFDWTDEWHDPTVPVRSLGWARYCYQVLSRASEAVVFRSASRIMVVSRQLERRLRRHQGKVIRLPMLFDPAPFARIAAKRLTPLSCPSIVYAGSISRIEGIPILLHAFSRLTTGTGARARLTLIGTGAQGESVQDYAELASRLGIADRVTFLAPMARDCLIAHLKGADLLVVPRTTGVGSSAGFPSKLVEYLASGTPVLVTRFGDVEEYLVDGRDCLLCAPDDPEAFAVALEYALDHRDATRALAAAGQSRVTELFSFDNGVGRFAQMLGDIERQGDRTVDRPVGAAP